MSPYFVFKEGTCGCNMFCVLVRTDQLSGCCMCVCHCVCLVALSQSAYDRLCLAESVMVSLVCDRLRNQPITTELNGKGG